jgi:uncharacterized protein with beta-barrel porin domain
MARHVDVEALVARSTQTAARQRTMSAWHSALVTGVASAALFAYSGRPVRAQAVTPPNPPCNQISGTSGEIVTCTGDLSPGVDLSNGGGPFQVLNVGNLTTDITPASGIAAILFTSNGSVELNVDTGPFAIHTTDAEGIFASSNGGTVTVTSTADVFTTGSSAVGIQASGQNDLVTITSSGNIATSGNNAFGIAAGTVYGDVTVTSTGDIATTGTFSAGINVGSIGQLGTTDGTITIRSTGNITTTGSSAIGINAATVYGPIDITSSGNIAVSGAASVGINAQTQGEVRITSTGNIAAGPDSSVAILALSQSGSVLITSTGDIATAGPTGFGIYARAGATAMVLASGNITTRGDNAPGIGASGYTGTAVLSSSNIRTFGANANGITAYGPGDVTVGSAGNITTTGDTSDGINVVSTNGMAAVVNSGSISATGFGSAGIYAAGYAGSIVINTGAVVGGPCCAGVMMDSAFFNQLLNWGTITAGLADYAVDMLAPSNTVDNFGTITGDVRMFDGLDPTGTFINHASGLLNSGNELMAAYVINDGTLAPGGRGTIVSTSVEGAFVQERTGVLAIDVDGAARISDQLVVSDTANLAGKVAVTLTSLPTTAAQSYLILQALSGVTNNGLTLTASPVLHATLSFPNANDVVLGFAVDFSVDGLNPNQRAIAGNLDAVLRAGAGGVEPVLLGLLNTTDFDGFKNALNQLSPEIYSDAQIAALYSSLAFSNSLLSCKVNGPDTASIIREGQCLWAGASARFLDTGTTFDQIGFNEQAGLFTAGAQVALADDWRLGVAAGYQSSTLGTATGATSDGSLGQAGIALKYNQGPLLLAAAVAGGGAHYDTRRPMSFGGFSGVAEGDQDLGIFSGTMRAAYVLGSPALYFKPSLDASLTRLQLSGFTEEGGNGAALTADGQGQTVFALAPIVESGTEWWLGNGTLVRPLIRAGAVWYDNADFALTAGFADAPSGVQPFTINSKIDEVMGVVGAGVDVISGKETVLRFSYDGQFGETTNVQIVGIKGSARF